MDSFSIKYPGCTVIEGDVCIGDCYNSAPSNITNLDGLLPLTSIKGKLDITKNPFLTSIEGLSNLTVLEDDVKISNNYILSSLDGLDQVRLMKGSFTIEWHEGLVDITGFEMLDTIMGRLTMTYLWNLTSVDAFSNLKYLGGYHLNGLGELVSIADMNNLGYLGDFILQDNAKLTEVPQFPLLSVINGHFQVKGNGEIPEMVGYENINRVYGDLNIDISSGELNRESELFKLNAFHQLTYVGGRFSFFALRLDTLDGFTALDSVAGSFSVNASLGFHNFPQNNEFKWIGGNISLTSLSFLEGLECLSALEQIKGLSIGSCPNLLSLAAISHITELGGGLELIRLNLIDLSDLANLTSIDGSLRIYDCNSLSSLSGLEGLTSMDGHIFIFRNLNLESLQGIQHIDPETIHATGNAAIIINGNPRLKICNVESICDALRLLRRPYSISDNAEGCDDISQIVCEDYGLSGIAYLDMNENKIKDTSEVGIPGLPVRFQPGDLMSPTNSEGRFFVFADSGDVYTMTIEQNSNWILTTDSLSYTSIFEEGSPGNEDHMFGLIPAYDWNDLSVDLTSDPIRCNQNVNFFLHWLNGSTRSVDGRITIQYDSKVTYVSSVVPPSMHNIATRELTWNIDSLLLFTGQNARITFKMPDETFVGQIMDFTARSFIDSSGTDVQMDVVEYNLEVGCAVDPNDKVVMPPGIRDEHYTLTGDALTYTIRFENLGNAEAIDITIVDTLDSAFDMSSFKVRNSSFPVLTMIEGHVVTFFLKNIWLVEKGTGFVTFEIKAHSDVPDLTAVENLAGIVFDFNQPILTNTTMNTLVEAFCQNVVVGIDTLICYGGQFMGLTEPGIYVDTSSYGSYCDSFTVINLHVQELFIIPLDTVICQGESFHGFDSTGVFTYDSINLATGCTDLVEVNLEVIPLGMGQCITGVLTIDEVNLRIYPNPAKDEIFVEASLPIQSVRLLTVDGKTVSLNNISLNGSNAKLQLMEGTSEGFYILAVQVDGQMYFEKVVVN